MYIILLIILLIIAFLSFRKFNYDILSPSVISILMFALCTFFSIIGCFYWNNVKLSIFTIFVIILGLLAFVLGEYFSRKKYNSKENKYVNSVIKIENYKLILTILGVVISIILIILEIKRICLYYGFESNNLSELLQFYRTKIGLFSIDLLKDKMEINFFVKQMKKACDVVCVIYMYIFIHNFFAKDKFKNLFINFIPVILCLFVTLLSSGRSLMMHMIVSFVMMFLLMYRKYSFSFKNVSNKNISKKIVFISLFSIIIALSIFCAVLPVIGRSITTNIFDYLSFYIGTSIPSFNIFLDNLPVRGELIGTETFSGIYYVLNKLSIINYVKPSSLGWSYFGSHASNVYTSFRRYYFDFGIIGVVCCQFIFGYLFSRLYLKIKNNDNKYLFIIYAFFSYVLIDQIRDEQFFTLLSSATIAYIFLILFLVWFIFNFKINYITKYFKKLCLMFKKNIKKIKSNSFWNNLFSNSFWAFLGDSFVSIITLIITIIIIKMIGSENYGVLVLAQSYMLIMDVLLNVQCWKSVIQYGQKAIVNKDINLFCSYVQMGCILDIVTALIGGVLSFLLVNIIGDVFDWSNDLILCAKIFSITIFTHFSGTPTAVLRLLNRFKLVAIQKIISSLVKVVSLLLVMFFAENISLFFVVVIYCITDILGNFLLIFFAILVFSKEYGIKKLFKKYNMDNRKEFVNFTLWGTFSEIVDIPVNYFDVFIISYLGTNLVSVFKVFKQFVSIISRLTTPIYQAIMPQFSELNAKGLNRKGYDIVIKIRNLVLTLMIPFSFLIGISSIVWLKWLYGDIYAQNWYILLVFLLIQTFASSYSTIHPYFLSLGNAKQSAYYVLIANIIYMFFSLIFVNKFGMLGLVISYFIQSLIVIFLKIKYIKNYKLLNKDDYREVIVVGGNHHNFLGVVRAFGEKGILCNAIITNANKYCFIKKSKYIKKCNIIPEKEDDIINLLINEYCNYDEKAVLIPTSDFAALVIDKNLKKLKKYFVVPNMNNIQNNIVKYMDKYKQYNLIKNSNINIARSWNLNLEKNSNIPNDIVYPCILKPMVSAFASKGDITICNDKNELSEAIKKYIFLNYHVAILQEYINFDQEYGLIGCIHNGNVILPGIIKKERIFPKKRGNVSYGIIDKLESSPIDFTEIINLLKKINYSGMFDIEIFIKDNSFYLNEINFRNSGNSYLYVYSNIYIVYLWYLMVCGKDIKDEVSKVKSKYYFTDEVLEIKQLMVGNINIYEWFVASRKSKIGFLINRIDYKPIIYKLIYAILRRFDCEK